MRKKLLVIALALSLALTSCGGGASKPTTSIKVTMTDFQFSPTQFTVPAGQEISLSSANTGAVVHNFVIMNLGTSAGTEFNNEDTANVYWEVEIQPGGSVDTSFTAPSEPGDYEVVCRTPGHLQAGMTAKMTVVAADE
jgi:uncharacterized cupredoxin-like copper-binding protein